MMWPQRSLVLVLSLLFASPAAGQGVTNLVERPGSVLVFPKFVRGTVDGQPKSSFEVSVTCPTGRVCPDFVDAVKLKALWVCPASSSPSAKGICAATDFLLFTTVRGTLWFNPENAVSAVSPNDAPAPSGSILTPFVPAPPCPRGFLVVWVVNGFNQPISFNGLVGDAVIRNTADDATSYNAIPIQSPALPTQVLNTDPSAPLEFDGNQYALLSNQVVAPVRYERLTAPQVRTDITLMTLDVRANRPNLSTFVSFDFYNENERSISASTVFFCWMEQRLTQIQSSLNTTFGGVRALKGLMETGAATQQNGDFPFQIFPSTLVGLVETKESNASGAIVRSYSYSLFQDGDYIATRLCVTAGANCPLP